MAMMSVKNVIGVVPSVENVLIQREKNSRILFAVLMVLRRGEINGLKYGDVDYINRTLKIQRQLGKKPNLKAEDVAPRC